MTLFEKIAASVAFALLGLALLGAVYGAWGAAAAQSAREECRSLGYLDGWTDGWKAWSKVCIGEPNAPLPVEKRTPISDARQR